MNVSNYNLIHSASLLFCNTFLSIYLLSHTLFWKINKKTELENTNQSQTLHTQCILYLDKRKEKGNMIIWIAINNPPKLTLMSQYQPIFWVSEIKEPINFLLLLHTTTSKTIFRKTNKGFCTTYTYYYSSWLDRNTTSLICSCAKYIKSWI